MSFNGSRALLPLNREQINQPGGYEVSRIRESELLQLNLLLPVSVPLTDLPEDRQRELSIALASLLLVAAGVEVNDDES